jgi:hypothetical protein
MKAEEEVNGQPASELLILHPSSVILSFTGLALVAALSLAPLFLGRGAVQPVGRPLLGSRGIGEAVVLLGMGLAIFVRTMADRRHGPYAVLLNIGFILVAAAATACHWCVVDTRYQIVNGERDYFQVQWQSDLYYALLSGEKKDLGGGQYTVPHMYRPLPYGFTRTLEWLTGNWWFACWSYRWFFTYWFVWSYYQFARHFRSPGRSLVALAAYPILYPFSILYYGGQLTDPMSHALFALALCYLVEDRWFLLAMSVALGVLAKETAVIIVLAYFVCHIERPLRALVRSLGPALAGTAAYVAARLPFGWRPASGSINETPPNLWANLGMAPLAHFPESIINQFWIQPLIFIGIFLPFIVWRWRQAEWPLKALFLTLVPLLFASQLLYGWLYESRNYVPLLPVLTTLALTPGRASNPGQVRNPGLAA